MTVDTFSYNEIPLAPFSICLLVTSRSATDPDVTKRQIEKGDVDICCEIYEVFRDIAIWNYSSRGREETSCRG